MFKPSRLASRTFLAGLYLLYVLLISFVNLYAFRLPFLGALAKGSSNIIQPTLVVNVAWIALFSVLLLGWKGFQLRDFGFRGSLQRGIGYTALLWLVIQCAVVGWQLASGNGLRLAPNLAQAWTLLVGTLLAQLLGNVLLEEPFWRGFVWSQLAFKLRPQTTYTRLYAALLGSLLFALPHIPNQLVRWQRAWADIPLWVLNIFILGLIFTFVYWLSGNLYIAIGFHALFNTQALVVWAPETPGGDIATDIIALVCGLLLVVFFRA